MSLPEWMYDELKRKAEEMGIQMTDLVKMYIKDGVEGNTDNEKDEEKGKYEESIAFLEAKVAQLDAIVYELLRKMQMMEEDKEDVEVVDK
ncbi:hypothetical protein IC006_2581 [Sulfuracidifex tepidarius]|uniref:Uncharacterized protein n=1 Tax=Sulfuracidifex tepidarius TaxID=1294262 RepID=A0A510E793_9CREN|nr:hypothetical protein IC006_2581 [Sulfuracidifex tepidarius]BBG28040.1 hypothetical protein IC007_2595 [Sulfuracidifex tepidarius]